MLGSTLSETQDLASERGTRETQSPQLPLQRLPQRLVDAALPARAGFAEAVQDFGVEAQGYWRLGLSSLGRPRRVSVPWAGVMSLSPCQSAARWMTSSDHSGVSSGSVQSGGRIFSGRGHWLLCSYINYGRPGSCRCVSPSVDCAPPPGRLKDEGWCPRRWRGGPEARP